MLGAYLIYAAALVLAHPQFIYPFGDHDFEAVSWRTEVVGERQVTLAVSGNSSTTAVLYFMGNGGALAYFAPTLNTHVSAGREVVAMEFRGGGGVEGVPSETGLKADALAAFDWLDGQHSGEIVVHGYSLGTGLALHVAANRDVSGVILDAPYVQLCELMTRASYVPACYLPWVQKWQSDADLPGVNAPALVQHGDADTLIPLSVGARMVDLMREAGLAVTFHRVEGATHTNLTRSVGYGARIAAFMADL